MNSAVDLRDGFGSASFRSAKPAKSRPLQGGASPPEPSQKPLDGRNMATNGLLDPTRGRGVYGPRFRRSGSHFPAARASAPVSELEALSARSGRKLLTTRGPPARATDAVASPHVEFAKHLGDAAR